MGVAIHFTQELRVAAGRTASTARFVLISVASSLSISCLCSTVVPHKSLVREVLTVIGCCVCTGDEGASGYGAM